MNEAPYIGKTLRPVEEVFMLSNGRVEFERAWIVLKTGYGRERPDEWPPNFQEVFPEGEKEDWSLADAKYQRDVLSQLKPEPVPVVEPEEEELFPGFHDEHEFWGGHALVRMAGERTEDDENEQIRDRINAALSTHLDKHGLFKLGGAKSFGIRTHILDSHRSGDGSNGDSIWAMIYPKTKRHRWPGAEKPNEPFLKTVMLRNSELTDFPQSTKGKDFNPPVEKVIHAHGIPKRVMKERTRQAALRRKKRRGYRKGEPMELALQLLKNKNPRPYALIPMFDLRHMLDSKSPIQEQLWMEHSPHTLADGSTSAKRDYNLLLDEAELRDKENTPFQLGDESIVQDFGEKVAPDFRYNVINEVRYPEQFQDIHTGEPMKIAFQLLKSSVRGTGQDAYDNVYHYPNELNYDAMGSYLQQNPNSTLGDLVSPYLQGQFTNDPTNVATAPPSYQSERPTQFQSTVAAPFPQTPEQVQGVEDLMEGGFQDYVARRGNPQKPHYDSMMNAVRVLSGRLRGNPAFDFKPRGFRPRRGERARGRTRNLQNLKMQSMLDTPVTPIMAEMTTAPKQAIPISTGEPMEIALQLLKERKSPEAWAHKLEYDKKYQKSPKRVKYREQLNAERRRRGIYGKGGKDVSHTQGGKLTLESAHSNRARHFKNRGTLRRVKVR